MCTVVRRLTNGSSTIGSGVAKLVIYYRVFDGQCLALGTRYTLTNRLDNSLGHPFRRRYL